MKLFINKELVLPYDPTNPPLPYIDDSLRTQPLGQPGLVDLDNPIYEYVSRGEDSKQIESQITDEVVKALMERDSSVRKSIMNKMYYYPESLGNISPKSYSEGHEVPRHMVKFTILDYAGANLISKEGKQAIEKFTNTTGLMDSYMAFSEAANAILVNNPSFYRSEINNFQDRANELNRGNLNKMLNDMAKENSIGEQKDVLKNNVKKYLNSELGMGYATQYLTSNNNPMVTRSLVDEIASKTVMNTKMLPEEIKAIIYLYATAENLNFSYITNWSAREQNNAIANMQNAMADLSESGNLDEFGKNVMSTAAAQVYKSLLGGKENMFTPLVQSALAKTGMAPAQNYEYLFESVGRRNFTVQAVFYPKSQREVRQAAQIISAFKYYSHPSRPDRSALVKVPCVFMLENMTYVDGKGWAENLYLPKYKICALLNTNVAYGQNGTLITHQQFQDVTSGPTFKAPVKITLSLNFQEMHVLTREDIPEPQSFFDANVEKNGYY